MTAGQEGIVITKIQIYTANLQKFGVSETKFCPFPSCPAVIWPCTKHCYTLKQISVLVHPFKGHQNWTILSWIKGGVKMPTNPETPCMTILNHCLIGLLVYAKISIIKVTELRDRPGTLYKRPSYTLFRALLLSGLIPHSKRNLSIQTCSGFLGPFTTNKIL